MLETVNWLVSRPNAKDVFSAARPTALEFGCFAFLEFGCFAFFSSESCGVLFLALALCLLCFFDDAELLPPPRPLNSEHTASDLENAIDT